MGQKKNLRVTDAARLLNKSPQFVRIGLQRGILPFGSAVKTSSEYSYYISAVRFAEYIGVTVDDLGAVHD